MAERVDITWHPTTVTREDRERRNGHRGCVLWFTGLSGSGKSTIANEVDRLLLERGIHTQLLDGDNVRMGLNASPDLLRERHGAAFAERFGLGFAPLDREENIRRIGAVAQLFAAAGVVTLTAFVSPYRRDRQLVRELVEQQGKPGDFWEIFVDTPLDVCEARDPKGLYKKARAGLIRNFTGIDDPYEPPESPELHLLGDSAHPTELATQVISQLQAQRVIP
jgi:adenylylsulfate kinase